MSRLSRVAVLVTVALGLLVPVVPPLALADPIGGVIIIPSAGSDLTPIRLRTSAGCPTQTSKFYATMRGQGFPPDGQIITSGTEAGLSTSSGFDVYVARIMRDYAAEHRTTLTGRYDITVHCTDSLAVANYGEFTGSLEFSSPTTYRAIGTAKPPASPPAPFPMMADDPVLAPDPTSIPPTPVTVPGQLASQRDDVIGQGVPWLVVALVSVALVTLVAAMVARHIRKRRAS